MRPDHRFLCNFSAKAERKRSHGRRGNVHTPWRVNVFFLFFPLLFFDSFFFPPALKRQAGTFHRKRVPPACVGKYATKRIYERVNSSPRAASSLFPYTYMRWSCIPDASRLRLSTRRKISAPLVFSLFIFLFFTAFQRVNKTAASRYVTLGLWRSCAVIPGMFDVLFGGLSR